MTALVFGALAGGGLTAAVLVAAWWLLPALRRPARPASRREPATRAREDQ